ncbi:hypothetical protein Syun_009563 [Stephania yunnanensis]|uniref:Uncharacterized protein n=1 Tax=Stephania yunnanensis TaxID=152371 RepID=A0AAP0PQS4_9MAGN
MKDLKYRLRIVDIIKARSRGLLTRDYNHLDLEDVPSERDCDILVIEFYANAYGNDSKTESRIVNYKAALLYHMVMRLRYLDVGKIIYESIRSAITTKKNDGLPFLLMIISSCKVDQVNITELEMDVLLKKTITDEFIERYGKINYYEDTKDEREKTEIARREKEVRRKIRDDTRRMLEEVSKAKNDPTVEQPTWDYDGLYMEELELAFKGTILQNQIQL